MRKPSFLLQTCINIGLIVAIGCGALNSKEPTPEIPLTAHKKKYTKKTTLLPKTITIEQTVQGIEKQRQVLIHAPKILEDQKKYPVVFALHGNGGNAAHWRHRLHPFVEKDGWIGIYPQGLEQSWNLGLEKSKADDVAFVNQIIEALKPYKTIDLERLFVIGTSNGAGMAHKLAIHSDHFRAIATIVTPLTDRNRPTAQTQPVSVLQISGMKDRLIPYEGGPSPIGHHFLSAKESARIWAQTNECDQTPQKSTTAAGNQKIEYSACKNNTRVIHYGAPKAGHRIPGDFEGGLIQLCLNFFETQE